MPIVTCPRFIYDKVDVTNNCNGKQYCEAGEYCYSGCPYAYNHEEKAEAEAAFKIYNLSKELP